ncbi:MAG: N,N-diacetyllegionaminate synthase [Alphaproteobacteria bacterium]|jgi:SAM-dependent methyltransferase|nr:N,N-diacetyllegionaminate synthase [Alphaproteobacteria bacterium]
MISSNCSICGGALERELLVITEPDRFERHVGVSDHGYRRAWVECSDCGTATDVLPPGPDRLADIEKAYYAIDFKNSSIPEKFAKIMSLPAERSDNAIRVDRVLDFLAGWTPLAGGPRRALDIGAGLGVFPARFMERCGGGWDMTAVEPDPMAAAHLASLGRFEVVHDGFPFRHDRGRFQLVTLNKVVEHIRSPVDYLRALAPVLDPENGIVYIEVPDKETIRSRPPSDNILGALHRHLYDLTGLLRLITEAGLVAIRLERIVEPSGKLSAFAFATLPSVASRLTAVVG